MTIRVISPADYEMLIAFWEENYTVTDIDDLQHLHLFLEKNPELSVLAEDENHIIGTALGSFDGRRGYLQKVVVERTLRHHGIGQKLIEEVCKRLKEAGAVYIPISVGHEVVPFYESCGFLKTNGTSMTKEL